jgi:hypothetical protein
MQEEDIPSVEPVCPEESQSQPYLSGAEVEFYQAPRLGIIHLLAWATVAVVLMKCNLAMEPYQSEPVNATENYRIATKALGYGSQIFTAAILVSGAVFWIDRLRNQSGANQPGHWILALQSLVIPAYLILWMVQSFCVGKDNRIDSSLSNFQVIFRIYAVISFFSGISFFMGAWRLPKFLLWKTYLGLTGLDAWFWTVQSTLYSFSLFGGFSIMIYGVSMYFRYGLCAFMVILIIVDIFQARRRDWLHWFGVAIPIFSISFTIANQLAMKLFLVSEVVK